MNQQVIRMHNVTGLGGWEWRERLAKAFGLANGYQGGKGGWIYNAAGRPVAHGWGTFYQKFYRRIWEG